MDKRLIRNELGFWQVEAKPDAESLRKYYAEKYYQQAKGSYEHTYSPEELEYFRAKLQQRWHVLRRGLLHQKPGRMLDVGCGEGFALAFFRELGYAVTGIDFSSAGVAAQNPGCLDCLIAGDVFTVLDQEIAAGHIYEVVWLQNVLEHVLDPLALLRSLRSLVAPGGMAVVTVPNDCSVIQRAALSAGHIDRAFWVAIPDHLSYFSRDSLISTANATGWECMDVLGDFPIDWFLYHPGSNYVKDKTAGKPAHRARVQLENLIHAQPTDDVVAFWSSLAKIGLGRDLTSFMRPVPTG